MSDHQYQPRQRCARCGMCCAQREEECLYCALDSLRERLAAADREILRLAAIAKSDAMEVLSSREKLAAAERGVDRLRLQLDAIEGAATGQPGSAPRTAEEGWSPALDAVIAGLRERDEALRRVDIAHEGTGNAWAETERAIEERDAAIAECRKRKDIEQEAAAAREEARRMGEMLVEYHNELRDAQWGTEWECPSCRRVANLGHYKECSIGNLLARWPEVKT